MNLTDLPDELLLELDQRAQASYAKSLDAVMQFPHDGGLSWCADRHRAMAFKIASEVARRLWAEADEFLA